MDVTELRERAKAEAADVGPVPANPREHELWVEERRGAIVLLAALADHDRDLLRSAATGKWVSITVRDRCSPPSRNAATDELFPARRNDFSTRCDYRDVCDTGNRPSLRRTRLVGQRRLRFVTPFRGRLAW
jgi:hypothetical protein